MARDFETDPKLQRAEKELGTRVRSVRRFTCSLSVALCIAMGLHLSGCVIRLAEAPTRADVDALFSQDPPAAPPVDVLALTPDMLDLIAETKKIPNRSSRLRFLLKRMLAQGLGDIEYHPFKTRTAAQTFATREGNCLSFTNLFVALAREAGLDARYQRVEIPPVWLVDGSALTLNNHVNVIVHDVRVRGTHVRDFIVDFNAQEYGANWRMQEVDDDHTAAAYHSNLAVHALSRDDPESALAQIHRALLLRSNIPHLWVNLGVIRKSLGDIPAAIGAYEQALAIDPSQPSALNNLAHLYQTTGREDRADIYLKTIARYQKINPYYHYQLAGRAYERADYNTSLAALKSAIHLNDDDPDFFGLLGFAHLQLGDRSAAKKAFSAAHSRADEDAKTRYKKKLDLLSR